MDGVCVCAGCHHVSVHVGVVRVQLGHAGEHVLCGAWVKPEVGCRVYQHGFGCIGEGLGHVGEGCGHIGEGCGCIGVGEGCGHVGEGHGYTVRWPFHGRQFNSVDYARCTQHNGTHIYNGRGGSVTVEQQWW